MYVKDDSFICEGCKEDEESRSSEEVSGIEIQHESVLNETFTINNIWVPI